MNSLASFKNHHHGETIVICGCGESLNDLNHTERFITIGVNDVGRRFDPTYLVVLNPRHQFKNDRFRYVQSSRARTVFTQLDLGINHPNIVRFKLGKRGGTDFSDPNVLHYTQNSTYVALCLAVHMGAKRIGLIGVDFTNNHFFGQTGTHPLARQFSTIDREYQILNDALQPQGIEVFNLSRLSRLNAFPKMTINQFTGLKKPSNKEELDSKRLKIVSYAITPVAGVPAILARCIESQTPHSCRCVWANNSYSNGVVFQGDIQWGMSPNQAEEILRNSDLIIVHNGKIDRRHKKLVSHKPVITMAHNYMWNVDQTFVKRGFPGIVVGQYQATLPEFKGWAVVPNPVPIWEKEFYPVKKGEPITIAYTPSGKHERYPPNHKLYWHSKGYNTTMTVLDQLVKSYAIQIKTVRYRQVSHSEALKMKQHSHIVIDECVTGSYHRNSLEGLALGCVVVNGLGLLPAVLDIMRFCASNGDIRNPFVHADLQSLERVLKGLIESGIEDLVSQGEANRAWMEHNWDFEKQWCKFWEPVIEIAMNKKTAKFFLSEAQTVPDKQTTTTDLKEGGIVRADGLRQAVSVVIPHGGQERLPQLASMLGHLRQCRGFHEIVVVDMSETPCAEKLANNWDAKYIYTHHTDVFERAKALNIGSALATCDLILWLDNDLVFPSNFIEIAAREIRTSGLDFLIPYKSIRYLSDSDSREVMGGALNPSSCKPVKALFSGRDIIGGAGLVRKEFILSKGGIPEDFKGWGGEDNAWFHKAHLLGRTGISATGEQHLYHLYHPQSGAYGGHPKWVDTPYYQRNLEVLKEIKSIHHPSRFLERFPPPAHFSCPWDKNKRILFIYEGTQEAHKTASGRTAHLLEKTFGIQIEQHAISSFDEGPPDQVLMQSPDAVVLYGDKLGTWFLTNPSTEKLRPKTLLVLKDDGRLSEPRLGTYAGVDCVLSGSKKANRLLKSSGLWSLAIHAQAENIDTSIDETLDLTHPLSIILGDGFRHTDSSLQIEKAEDDSGSSNTLPVWMYWEGSCPSWIQACQKTIFAHASNVRSLSADEFDKLRLEDRNIDLDRLLPAQRADFVRAYLLAKYGGLWIDSDCIVTKSLEPILKTLEAQDFLGYRDRQGYCANSFIGARPGSLVASAFYRRVCEILRSGQPIGWISLGGQPLTEILTQGRVGWHEIEGELIQPVCWSRPDVFFNRDETAAFDRIFDHRAICYMLSNNEIQKFQKKNPARNLLDEGTFFRYLLNRALENHETPKPAPMLIQSRSDNRHIPHSIDTIIAVSPQRMLTVGAGCGRWGVLIRVFIEASKRHARKEKEKMFIEGIELNAEFNLPQYEDFFDRFQLIKECNLIQKIEEGWNLTLFIDILCDLPEKLAREALVDALEASDYVYVVSPFRPESINSEPATTIYDGNVNHWPLSSILSMDPLQYTVFSNTAKVKYGAFLFSRKDPGHLKYRNAIFDTFNNIYQENVKRQDESLSGPGSSLEQTTEIRQRIPLLLQEVQARSMLDVPCGDFNWMKNVHLGIDIYIGADIVSQLIEENRKRFGRSDWVFLTLDISTDHLPQVDVILCRDCLVHLSFIEIHRTLKNIKRSGSNYLLATTFCRLQTNIDIRTGSWRPLNLVLPPFNFPQPIKIINEKCTEAGGRYSDKSLGLWRIQDLPVFYAS